LIARWQELLATVERWPPPIATLILLACAVLIALLLYRVAVAVMRPIARRFDSLAHEAFIEHCGTPTQLLMVLIGARIVSGSGIGNFPGWATHTILVGVIAATGWLGTRLTRVLEHVALARLRIDAADNLEARKIHTQLRFVGRLVVVGIVILTASAILLSFDGLRQLGAGLLTSAGIAGIVIGLAAQKTVGNLIAGFQIAFTQPIRTDDVVIVEGEWGRIEEITLTYVVVRIWDLRRLVVPISYFIERPFQNWTRTSADLLGTVFLRLDYRVPVEEIRQELQRILAASPHWDGVLWRVHVTEAGERSIEVRALVSAANSDAAWELRCEVREKLVTYLQQHHPEALPRIRAELETAPPRD
jgi:small-conductance mechanosensitive channel